MKTTIASNVCEPLLEVSSTVSPASPAIQNNSVTASVPAASKAADNFRIKLIKAVVTEIKKETKGQTGDLLHKAKLPRDDESIADHGCFGITVNDG